MLKSSVRSGAWYAACQSYESDGTSLVFAAICLIRWNPKARDGYIFAYKDMEESMGRIATIARLRFLTCSIRRGTNTPRIGANIAASDWR
ncbi:hypothetical protein [Croceicoccus naphthovorans]|uniref:hypothetical protein n=1 Tax=Croceicoccus naphthovorans TaxID=1348774 RepID=UPI000A4906EA|nr:hypothetical protein [Croceicoccus naphthovorans]